MTDYSRTFKTVLEVLTCFMLGSSAIKELAIYNLLVYSSLFMTNDENCPAKLVAMNVHSDV